jgi:hydrogenase expression/formation protein HypE
VEGHRQVTNQPLHVGKLPPALLAALLNTLPHLSPDVLMGAAVGVDAAVIDLGDRCLVVAMDPVSLSDRPGRFAADINANDVAVMGATPRWLLSTILLPPETAEGAVRAIMDDLSAGCRSLGVSLIGGHTEVTPAVRQPVVCACLIGEVARPNLITSAGALPGDFLLLAGPVAVEGTAILASEHAGELRRRGVRDEIIGRAASLLETHGISIVPSVRVLTEVLRPHAMHDPTEGGILGAVAEMMTAAGLSARVEAEAIPLLDECAAICAALDLDPLRLLASGSLLAAISPDDAPTALRHLGAHGIEPAVIGTVLPAGARSTLIRNGREEALPEAGMDELARWLR